MTTQSINVADVETIQKAYRNSLNEIVDDVIGLTDAFGFTDYELNTSLGKENGNPYGELWETIQSNPLNSDEGREELGVCIFLFMGHFIRIDSNTS